MVVVSFSSKTNHKTIYQVSFIVLQQQGLQKQLLNKSASSYVNSNVSHSTKATSTPYINVEKTTVLSVIQYIVCKL